MKDNNTEYFGPEFLASLASDNTPTEAGLVSRETLGFLREMGARFLRDGNAHAASHLRCAIDTLTLAAPKPPSAEAVAWLRELAQWLDCRCGDKQEKQRLGCQLACREYRFVADILRFVENAPRNAHRPDNSAMHPDGRIGGTR